MTLSKGNKPIAHMARQNQCDRLLALLKSHEGYWVPLYNIMYLHIASHTARISDLRKQGFTIEKQERRLGGQRLVEYRLMPKTETFKGETENAGISQ
jgi:hypothetical protein